MNKDKALERLAEIEKETAKLRKIIETPEVKINTIQDIYDYYKPKYFINTQQKISQNLEYLEKNRWAAPTEKFARHQVLYSELKMVEYYIAEKYGKCDWENDNSRKFLLYYNHVTKTIDPDWYKQVIKGSFNFISLEAQSEFIRIVTEQKIIEYFTYNLD